MPASPLTVEQKADAARLKALFTAWQAVRRSLKQDWSQDSASGELGFGQSAMNQYLNGRIPLNPEAATKFSKLLGCAIADFSPAVAQEIAGLAQAVTRGTTGAVDAKEPAAAYTVITTSQAIDTLADALMRLHDDDSIEAASLFMQKMAADPRGRWAGLLADLLHKEAGAQGEGKRGTKVVSKSVASPHNDQSPMLGTALNDAENPVIGGEENNATGRGQSSGAQVRRRSESN